MIEYIDKSNIHIHVDGHDSDSETFNHTCHRQQPLNAHHDESNETLDALDTEHQSLENDSTADDASKVVQRKHRSSVQFYMRLCCCYCFLQISIERILCGIRQIQSNKHRQC
jgi:hypothetical protein